MVTSSVPPPEVEDHDLLGLLRVVQPIGQRGGGGLVDDPHDLQAGDGAGILGGLSLIVVEVRRDGDDRLGDRLPQERLGVPLDLLQDERRDLLRSVLLAMHAELVVGAHLALGRGDGALGIGDRLPPGRLADQQLALLGECHVRGESLPSDAGPFRADGMMEGLPPSMTAPRSCWSLGLFR